MFKKVCVGLSVFMFALFLQQGETSASELVIVSKQDRVPIYDNRGDVLSEMGMMRSGEPLIVTEDFSIDFWQVKFGNAYGYVYKDDVEVENDVTIDSKNEEANTNTVVLINQDADVYDNSTGTLKKFVIAKEGYRYPILSESGNWWKIDVGGRVGYLHKSSTSIDKGIPVLMYHHILSAEEKADSPYANKNSTTIDTHFNEQMDYLKNNGFTTISTKDLEGYLNHRVNLPAKSVVITIDDGNISSRVYAYPKLKELEFVADQFIITDRTPETSYTFDHKRLRFLSKQEMAEMADVFNYYGHTHGLHSLTSSNESFVTAKDRDEVKKDLLLNRKLLKNMTYLAYPFGQYTEDTLNILKETGFTMAYTTKQGRARLGMNQLLIPRMGIEPFITIEDFANRVNN